MHCEDRGALNKNSCDLFPYMVQFNWISSEKWLTIYMRCGNLRSTIINKNDKIKKRGDWYDEGKCCDGPVYGKVEQRWV